MGKLVNESLKLVFEVFVLIGLVSAMVFAISGVNQKVVGNAKR